MKLLLTSNGLSNTSIAQELFRLAGKPASEIHISFIPTAMNVDYGNKGWFINDLLNLSRQNFKYIDIVDISALPRDVWQPRLEAADVVCIGGGNTYHLMRWMKESGLSDLLPDLLLNRVYVGISAGSIITNPHIALTRKDKKIYYEENFGYSSDEALGMVDFYIRPHYNSPEFPHTKREYLESVAEDIPGIIYALDNNSAISWVDGKVEVISEGEYLILNKE